MKKRWVLLLVFSFLLNACSVMVDGAGDAATPVTDLTPAPVETAPEAPGGDMDPGKPPLAVMTVNGDSQTAGLGTYCWSDDSSGAGLCLDAIGIPTPEEPLEVTSPFTAQFLIPVEETPRDVVVTVAPADPDAEMNDVSDQGWRWWSYREGENHQLALEREPQFNLDLEPGLYVINLFVSWDGLGDASYGFLEEGR